LGIIWAKMATFQTYQLFFRRTEDSSSKQRTLIDVIMQFLLPLAHYTEFVDFDWRSLELGMKNK
jgi:hypothetical protein